MDELDIDRLRHEHAVALRAWQFAWSARDEWQRTTFPLRDGDPGVVYDYVVEDRENLRAAEERAYDRFLSARQVLLEALRSKGSAAPDQRSFAAASGNRRLRTEERLDGPPGAGRRPSNAHARWR